MRLRCGVEVLDRDLKRALFLVAPLLLCCGIRVFVPISNFGIVRFQFELNFFNLTTRCP